MASDAATSSERLAVTVADLVAFTKKELEADAERQGKISAAGELPRESHTGCTLDLSHRKIQLLPPEVISLIRDRVERLALSHNPSISLPAQLVQCDRLRYLNLRWNQLTEFPQPVLQLSKLEILDISKNKVTAIPDEIKNLTSLKFLAVARNQITRLPTALGEMASLSKLKFDDNPLEYPPADVLKPHPSNALSSEREKEVCQQVKRYLKAAAMRDKLRTNSSEDLSESNAETPRPPRRTVTGGRFPVRPSVSGIENVDELKGKSPNHEPAPPIPLRSHARVASNHSTTRRPSHSPSSNPTSDSARTRSDTVSSSASVRSRRQGFVPRKTNDLGSVNELANRSASQSPFGRAMHSRASSSISTVNGFLAAGSGGESSSGAVSPVDGSHPPRFRATPRLSSLPESRHSRLKASHSYKACRRVMVILFDLNRALAGVVYSIKDGTPRKTMLERQLSTAGATVRELDRLATKLNSDIEEGIGEDRTAMLSIFATSVSALKAYGTVLKELKQTTQKMMLMADVFQIRALMNQFYYASAEIRNVCTLLGFECKPASAKDTPRQASFAWSSRTVTPTQPMKPVNTKRLRGATILQSMNNGATLRAVPPPVHLNGRTSRSNTIVSQNSAVNPRVPETPLLTASSSATSARSTPIRVVTDVHDTDEQFERIFLKLRGACDMIAQALPGCRREFVIRKEHANANGQPAGPHYLSGVITRCDAVLNAQDTLLNRLKVVKLKDPSVRYQKEFWQLCDGLVKAWADFMIAVQELASRRLDLSSIKAMLRPVQKTMKDTSKMISESSLYHQASRPSAPSSAGPGLAPPFPSNTPYGYGTQSGPHSGYVTPVPATPLSAALGPAVQATQAFGNGHYMEQSYPGPHGLGVRGAHERVDTVMQHTQGRRLP